MSQNWLYPVNPAAGFRLTLSNGQEVPVGADAIWGDMEKTGADPAAWVLSGYRLMKLPTC